MGKKRIEKLLTDLKDNHDRDLNNAAGIYTVAQVALNQLANHQRPEEEIPIPDPSASLRFPDRRPYKAADLKAQYPSLAACRTALTARGLKFSKTPSWAKIAIALTYFEAQQACFNDYLKQYPCSELTHLTMTFRPNPDV